MFQGGLSFNPESDKAVRYIALLGTPIFAGYNMLVFFGLAHSTNYAGDTVCLIISALWVLVGIYHFIFKIRSRFDMLWRLVLYHAISLATILFITGFVEPFASSIALLFLASNIYFGRKALIVSLSSVAIAAIIDAIIRYPDNHEIVGLNLMGAAGILILGVAMTGVIIAQETRRQALIKAQAKERLQYERILTIINNLTDAAFSTNEDGEIQLYNAAALELLDTNKNLHGEHISKLFTLTDPDGTAMKLFDIIKEATRTTRRDDLRHTYGDDDQIRLEITYAPIRADYNDKKKTKANGGYIIIMRDVTKAKSLEEERDEFISVVSHELRTPITIMEGTLSNLQLMLEKNAGDAKTNADSVKMAHDQSVYLAKMVNDLSTLSRAERGVADEGEDIDVAQLMRKMFEQYHSDATARGLKLNMETSPELGTVHVSRLYLEELLQNFITNAIKYTKEGSVTLFAKTTKGKVTFTVKDTGLGISRTDQQKIFTKFYRSEDYRIRETSGTGLGLYVCAKLAKKLNTQIEFSSRLNHGSSFGLTLPLSD
jgi:two-component system, OmpR family, phosphate regulon sensor histidine kinase PhoR